MGPAYTFSWGVDMEVQNVETSEKDDERASVVIDFVNLETDYQDSDSYIVTKPGQLWRVLEYNPI
jgi:hypothetical protein